MALVIINSGHNGVSNEDSFFPNYGTGTIAYNSQYFSFPSAGYIKYISMSYRPASAPNHNDQPFTLINETIPQTYDSIITFKETETIAYEKYESSDIAFSALDRFRFKNNLQFFAYSTNVTFFAEIPSISDNVISVIGSMRGMLSIPKSEFTSGNFPYSYGSNNLLNTGEPKSSIGFILPKNCSLTSVTFTLPNSIGSDATLNIQKNGVNVGTVTVTSGNTVGVGSLSESYLTGDQFRLECATTNSISYSTVLMIFEV
jgi:hypothetical protein